MFALRVMGEIGDAVRLKLRRERRLRLPKNKNCGKAITLEQESSLLESVQVPDVPEGEKMDLKATRSPVILPSIMLALNTTMRVSEIRTLRYRENCLMTKIHDGVGTKMGTTGVFEGSEGA